MIINEFNTTQAAELAGFKTASMVNYLCREGIVKPSISGSKGRGRHRYFNFKEVFLLKAINRILAQGVSISKFKKALKKSNDIKGLIVDMGTLEGTLGGVQFMYADSANIYLRQNHKEIINLTKNGQLEFAFILDLTQIHSELVSDVKEKIINKMN